MSWNQGAGQAFRTGENAAHRTLRPKGCPVRVAPTPRRHQLALSNHSFLRTGGRGLQPKFTLGAPHDRHELEAERVAEQVMSMSDARLAAQAPASAQATSEAIRREGAFGRQIVNRDSGERRHPGQLRRLSDDSQPGRAAPPIVPEALHCGGQPLDAATRAFMEPRFGRDFGQVRVHTDQMAAQSAQTVSALAYTIGEDVVFGAGRYLPATREGQSLIAHELTHVVQQRENNRNSIQRKIEVKPGLELDTMGYTTSKAGNIYSCPAIAKDTIWHELFTALLFSARVFKLKGNTNGQINANFRKHMQARYGILEFASKKKYTFGAGSAFKMNPKYWVVDSSGWDLKPGANRTEAINDLNVHPGEYAIACLAATTLTMEGGSQSPLVDDSGVAPDDWIPGDWGYITNTAFPASGGTPGLEGENIIYTGKDTFWGHFGPGNTYKSLTDWFAEVQGWNGGAKTEDFRTRPNIGLE